MQRKAAEETISDGTRYLGRVLPKGDAFECFDADEKYLCKCPSITEARAAIRESDQARRDGRVAA